VSTRRLAVGAALALGLLACQPPLAIAAGPQCEFNGIDRVVAIGDVHGAYERFVEILKTAGLIDQKEKWTGGKTYLVQTGDIVDRGAGSRKAADLLMRLQDDARKAGGAVLPLLGNHEVMRMVGDTRYVVPGEYDAFTDARSEDIRQELLARAGGTVAVADVPLGLIEMRQAFGQNGKYGKWLRTLNTVVKINGIVFLHGGISPMVADMTCDTINDTVRRELTTDLEKMRADPTAGLAGSEQGPLWYRGLAQEPETFAPTVDDILAKQHADTIVVGHTVTQSGRIVQRFGGKVIQIDTGMQQTYVPKGRASALDIQKGVFTALYVDGREVLPRGPAKTPAVLPAAAGR